MARTRARVAPVPEHNALIASAVKIPPATGNAAGKPQQWQADAWGYYDKIGELRYVSNWVGNVMSRARLVAARNIDGVLTVDRDGPGAETMNAFCGGLQGQAQFLQSAGVHLTVAGEFYEVAASDDEWYTLAFNKVTSHQSQTKVDYGDGKPAPLKGGSYAIRVWTPHPTMPVYADSPVRSNIGTLAELASLNAHVKAQLTSRLAGAGILMLPSEIQFPVKDSADPQASQADAFMGVLADAMMTPIQDPDSPSAVVPIVVTAPGEYLGDVKHVTFWTELDEKVVQMRDNAVKRLALGLDTPPEVLLGMAESNHWNAWLVDEAAVKSHLEPRLSVVCHALTEMYLRPALKDSTGDEWYVLADTSEIRLRPNRSREALELYDRGELSGEAARRETGFKQEDAPDDDEYRLWLLRKIATGSTSPEQTQAALRLLGADLGSIPGQTDDNAEIAPVLEPRRTLRGHPENKVPDRQRSEDDRQSREGLIAAADVLVYRALERVGNRLANGAMKERVREVEPHLRYLYVDEVPENALDGTWAFAKTVFASASRDCDATRTCVAVDGYVRFLLGDRRKHDRAYLEAALIAAGVISP